MYYKEQHALRILQLFASFVPCGTSKNLNIINKSYIVIKNQSTLLSKILFSGQTVLTSLTVTQSIALSFYMVLQRPLSCEFVQLLTGNSSV